MNDTFISDTLIDSDGKKWWVQNWSIYKECSPRAFVGGKQRLAGIKCRLRWYVWVDLGGNESVERYPTTMQCMTAFVEEMRKRSERNDEWQRRERDEEV